jgi:lipopolysaccharide transport system permease protein
MNTAREITVDARAASLPDALREVGNYRELVGRLVYRGLKVRYTQSVLGPFWVLVEPVISMVVFTLVFSGLLNVESGSVPYPLFNFGGLVIWTYFVNALGNVTLSLTNNINLVTKIYVPRLVLPLVGAITPLLDLLVAFAMLLVLMLVYGTPVQPTMLLLPVFVLAAWGVVMAVGLPLAILNTRYRDVGIGLPTIMRVLIYTTPVIYPLELVPDQWRWVYDLNPVAHIVQGFRWCIVQDVPPNLHAFAVSCALTGVLFVASAYYFQRAQRNIVDRL